MSLEDELKIKNLKKELNEKEDSILELKERSKNPKFISHEEAKKRLGF